MPEREGTRPVKLLRRSLLLLAALAIAALVAASPAGAVAETIPPVVEVNDAQVLQTRPASARVPAHDAALMLGMGLSLAGVVILRQEALRRWGPPRPALTDARDLVDLRELVSVEGPRYR